MDDPLDTTLDIPRDADFVTDKQGTQIIDNHYLYNLKLYYTCK